jgi:hypothetical protein
MVKINENLKAKHQDTTTALQNRIETLNKTLVISELKVEVLETDAKDVELWCWERVDVRRFHLF